MFALNPSLQNDKIAKQFHSTAYQLVEKIGEGGFGHVYLATQINTGQAVAIKFLSINSDFDETKRARYVERFERETLLSSRLQHPNIVRLLDKGENGDLLFAVFEYVEGETLKQRLTQSGALSATEAAGVMTQVLDALAHAHQQGVVHRDIKPANIMLTESAATLHVKVLDFGIGTLVNEARVQDYKSITLTQETLGTPSYSSPEQLRGEPATVKTDLYVWGLVFIECLTGKPAMSGSNLASIFHKQLNQESVALPSAIVGHPLAALLRRVLQKKAHLRSVNAPDLYHEIQHINVANLVGELQSENDSNTADVNVAIDNDITLINDNPLFNTGHTERKQFTVMAVRLNAKVVTGKEIDFEVIDTLHHDQKNQCLDTATRYGAFHVGSLGDTQLFYYGYPAASGNDARLCARTALDLVSDLHKRNALLKNNQGIQLEIKIGIHTGLLTCYADAIPEGGTANIALELVRLAGNGQILCSDSSQKILQSYIEFKPLSFQPLGVTASSTALFNLMAERQVEAFGFLRAAQNNHLFIGREKELKTLLTLKGIHDRAKTAHLFGEAGIGKSRLTFEFRNKSNQYIHFMAQCLPEHINNALYPILNILNYKYALTSLSSTDAINKLKGEISTFAEINLDDILPILSAWLGYPLAEGMIPSVLSPDLQKQLLFKTLIALLNKQDSGQANLIVFEDMHWADPTSLEFINSFSQSECFIGSNNLFISTSRQPLPAIFTDETYQSIELQKLSKQDSKDFINNLFDKQNVTTQLLDAVVTRTDGIPLFIEELVDMLKQKGLVQYINGITDFIDSEKVDQLPASLRDSLQQKLDSLVYSKETAQLAATIGREFDYNLLVASSSRSEAQLQTDLQELVGTDLILQKRRVSGDSYIFKHALVRDTAYESMTSDNKKTRHSRIANCLVEQFNAAKDSPALLLHHYSEAQQYVPAIEFGINAAKKSLEKFNNEEAINYSEKVLAATRQLDDNQCNSEKININNIYIQGLMAKEGWASERVKKQINYSQQLLELTGVNIDSIPTLWALCTFYYVAGDSSELQVLVNKLFNIARESEDIGLLSATNLFQAHAYQMVGEYEQAFQHLTLCVDQYDKTTHSNHGAIYGLDTLGWAKATLALNQCLMGNERELIQYSDEAVQWCDEISHIPTLGLVLLYRAKLFQYMGDKENAEKVSDELLMLTGKYGLPAYEAYALLIKLWATKETDIELANGVCVQLKQLGCNLLISYYDSLVADKYFELGEYDSAVQKITDCLQCCENMNEREYEPELYRRRGEYLIKIDKQKALIDLQTAVEKAKQQQMKLTQHNALQIIEREF